MTTGRSSTSQGPSGATPNGSASVTEVRVYLAKLAFMIAVGVGAMTLAAVTAWKLYGPTEPEWIERAPVPERGAAVPASPAFSR